MINHNIIIKTKELEDKANKARELAHGCPTYAPGDKKGLSAGEMTYQATRSGATSASAGERWMAAEKELEDYKASVKEYYL